MSSLGSKRWRLRKLFPESLPTIRHFFESAFKRTLQLVCCTLCSRSRMMQTKEAKALLTDGPEKRGRSYVQNWAVRREVGLCRCRACHHHGKHKRQRDQRPLQADAHSVQPSSARARSARLSPARHPPASCRRRRPRAGAARSRLPVADRCLQFDHPIAQSCSNTCLN